MNPRFTGLLILFVITLLVGLLLISTSGAPLIGALLLVELGGMFAAAGDNS
jgi:hypothetical protein